VYYLEEVPLTVEICVQGRVVCNQLLICSLVPNAEKMHLQSRKHSGKTKETHYPDITLHGDALGMGNTCSSCGCSSWAVAHGEAQLPEVSMGRTGPGPGSPTCSPTDDMLLGLGPSPCRDPCSVYQGNDSSPPRMANWGLHLSAFVRGFEILNKHGC